MKNLTSCFALSCAGLFATTLAAVLAVLMHVGHETIDGFLFTAALIFTISVTALLVVLLSVTDEGPPTEKASIQGNFMGSLALGFLALIMAPASAFTAAPLAAATAIWTGIAVFTEKTTIPDA